MKGVDSHKPFQENPFRIRDRNYILVHFCTKWFFLFILSACSTVLNNIICNFYSTQLFLKISICQVFQLEIWTLSMHVQEGSMVKGINVEYLNMILCCASRAQQRPYYFGGISKTKASLMENIWRISNLFIKTQPITLPLNILWLLPLFLMHCHKSHRNRGDLLSSNLSLNR